MKAFHILTLLNVLISVLLFIGFLSINFELSEKEQLNYSLLQNAKDELISMHQDLVNKPRLNELSLSEAQYESLLQEIENRDLYNRKILNEKSTKSEANKLNKKLESVDFKASDFSQVIKDTLPAVVKITVKIPVEFKEIFEEQKQEAENTLKQKGFKLDDSNKSEESILPVIGSGAIINSNGLIITNKHVANAEEEICNDEFAQEFFTCVGLATIEVISGDGKQSSATISKLSDKYDIALLKTNLKGKALSLSKSDINTGTEIVILGNPQDIDFSATKGIISGINRDLGDGLDNFWLQTDAPINEGNSGGPLINKNGEIVGIATLKLGGLFNPAEGLGFAIPSRIIREELFS